MKIFRYSGYTFILCVFCLIIIYSFIFKSVSIDRSIKQKALQELNSKKYFSFFDNNTKVTTDFSLEQDKTDTVYWQCTINEANILKFIDFHVGDGYSGMNISLIKLANRYRISIQDYTDNLNSVNSKYEIIHQNLTLDKENYKKGDSIFGRIDLKILEKRNKEKLIHTAGGYFKGKVN